MEKTEAAAALDLEWVELLKVAKQIGLTIEEIKEFLRQSSHRKECAE